MIDMRRPSLSRRFRLRVGVCWFADGDSHYRMQQVLKLPHDIPWNYERWLERAENQLKNRNADHRFLALKIVVDPDVFLAWCMRVGLDPDAEALQRYVNRRVNGDEFILRKSLPRPKPARRTVAKQ